MTLISTLLGLCLVGPTPASAPAQPATPVVRAVGIGRPPPGRPEPQARLLARRAGEVGAVRNLARLIGQTQNQPAGGTHAVSTQARIQGYRYTAYRTLADGSVEVTVEWPARGPVAVAPAAVAPPVAVPPRQTTSRPAAAPRPATPSVPRVRWSPSPAPTVKPTPATPPAAL